MQQAKNGDTLKVHYTGRLEDGTVFDSSREREPLEFKLGEGQLVPGFEKAVTGMAVGESKTVTIPSEEAYGPHRDDLILKVPREHFPMDTDPEMGQQLQLQTQDGQMLIVTVAGVSDAEIILDSNHFLAGKTLEFDLELMELA